ncbi:MAG: phosphoglycolate phosphatase-like HAD superfamily hydrolase [Cognaticolwellia sp.]
MKVLACDIDGALIDVRPSFYRIIHELSDASLEDIHRFKSNGGFNCDWDTARACASWIGAGRPEIFGQVKNVQDVLEQCGHDPGDLQEAGQALYRGGYWKDETLLVPPGLMHTLSTRFEVVACTGRDRWELERAQDTLGFEFSRATTMEEVRKPDPEALLRLLPADSELCAMFGDSEDDRRVVQNAQHYTRVPLFFFPVTESPMPLLQGLVDRPDTMAFLKEVCEYQDPPC